MKDYKVCRKCGKKIHYAPVCPYCGTVQKIPAKELIEVLQLLSPINEVDPSLRPPKRWFNKMFKRVSSSNPDYSDERVNSTIGSIWYNLPTSKKSEIREREGKQYGSPKN